MNDRIDDLVAAHRVAFEPGCRRSRVLRVAAGDDRDVKREVVAYLFFFSNLLFEQPGWEVVTEP